MFVLHGIGVGGGAILHTNQVQVHIERTDSMVSRKLYKDLREEVLLGIHVCGEDIAGTMFQHGEDRMPIRIMVSLKCLL